MLMTKRWRTVRRRTVDTEKHCKFEMNRGYLNEKRKNSV